MTVRSSGPPSERRGGLPRWVKVGSILVALAILVIVAMLQVRGGGHRIPQHGTDQTSSTPTPRPGHTPPEGAHP